LLNKILDLDLDFRFIWILFRSTRIHLVHFGLYLPFSMAFRLLSLGCRLLDQEIWQPQSLVFTSNIQLSCFGNVRNWIFRAFQPLRLVAFWQLILKNRTEATKSNARCNFEHVASEFIHKTRGHLMDMDLIRIHVVYAIFGILFLWFAPETNSFGPPFFC